MNYKLTIDANLMNEETKLPAMGVLKRWKEEGKIDLIEANPPRVEKPAAYGWPGASPSTTNGVPLRKKWGHVRKKTEGGISFRSVSNAIYPSKDSEKLNMTEMNNVFLLIKHHERKNEFLVTHNVKDFIEEGRQDRLRANFGIIAISPEGVVEMLSSIEGWK